MNTKRILNVLLLITLAIYFAGCGNSGSEKKSTSGKLEGKISISGAFALYPMTVKWAEEFMKEYPGVRIDISAGGAGKGMTDALSGMVDLGMVSREISPAEVEKGAWFLAVTKDAVLPSVNTSNPVLGDLMTKGMTKEMFQELFLTDNPHNWGEYVDQPNTDKVIVYTRSDACGAAEMWGKYLGKNQESLRGVGVFGDPGIANAVKQDKFSIGYNNVNYVYDMQTRKSYAGMVVIPIDLNGSRVIEPEENFYGNLDSLMSAIRTGKYPSPPARDLYMVAKGKPAKPEVIAFLNWILTSGQKFVNEAGYVNLTEDKIASEKNKLQ
jgi:phosphate transport system substrate-binding protein